MANLLILGAGMMGTALAQPIADAGHAVRLVGTWKDRELVAGLRADRVHAKMGTRIDDRVTVFDDTELDAALAGVDAIALGVSSAGIPWALEVLAPRLTSPLPIFMITKGLVFDAGTLRTLPEVVRAGLPAGVRERTFPAAIAGPCIAGELARKVETCVVLAGEDPATNEAIRALVAGPYYHVFPTTDVVGAEVCAALKNAFAMGIAFAEGQHQARGGAPGSVANHNVESAVFAQAVLEMRALARALGSPGDLAAGLAGVGDLDVTTNGGRTGRFGRLLGAGLTVPDAIAKMDGATLECLEILRVVEEAFEARAFGPALDRAACPLLSHLVEVALHDTPVALPFTRFFGPELRA